MSNQSLKWLLVPCRISQPCMKINVKFHHKISICWCLLRLSLMRSSRIKYGRSHWGRSLIFPRFSRALVQVCINSDLKVWEGFAWSLGWPNQKLPSPSPHLGIPLVKSGQKWGQVRWWVEMIQLWGHPLRFPSQLGGALSQPRTKPWPFWGLIQQEHKSEKERSPASMLLQTFRDSKANTTTADAKAGPGAMSKNIKKID